MTDALGMWLRRARETQQKELEDVEKVLRIRRRYLQALEVGDYTALPGEIQTRGFLRNYARYLGLPVEDALARYDADVSGRPMQPRAVSYAEPPRQVTGMRSWAPPPPTLEEEVIGARNSTTSSLMRIAIGLIVVFVVIALASFLWLQFGASLMGGEQATPVADVPQDTVSTVVEEVVATQTSVPEFPVSADGMIRVRIMAESSAWIKVSTTEQIVIDQVIAAGEIIEAESDQMVQVSTGNGGAFRVYINGTDWGLLGTQGEVVRRSWTPAGEAVMEGN